MATAAVEPPGSFAALVVCDGVSTSTDSDLASLTAARAARDVLVDGHPLAPAGAAGRIEHWNARLVAAGVAANGQATIAAQEVGSATSPPSCTFVAAVAHESIVVAGWVGDSRAYWLPDGGPAVQLSIDDSWAAEQIAQGTRGSRRGRSPGALDHPLARGGQPRPDPPLLVGHHGGTDRLAARVLRRPVELLLRRDRAPGARRHDARGAAGGRPRGRTAAVADRDRGRAGGLGQRAGRA
jgi:hypothetical protein